MQRTEIEAKVESLVDENQYLKHSLAETDNEFSKFESDTREKLAFQEMKLENYKAEIKHLKTEQGQMLHASHKTECETLKEENTKIQAELTKANEEISHLQSRIQKVKEMKAIAVASHQSEKSQLLDKIAALESRIDELVNQNCADTSHSLVLSEPPLESDVEQVLTGQFSALDLHSPEFESLTSDEYLEAVKSRISECISAWKRQIREQGSEIMRLQDRIIKLQDQNNDLVDRYRNCEQNWSQLEEVHQKDTSSLLALCPVFDTVRLELQETIHRIQTWYLVLMQATDAMDRTQFGAKRASQFSRNRTLAHGVGRTKAGHRSKER
jgi:chromosome segregation ATPase